MKLEREESTCTCVRREGACWTGRREGERGQRKRAVEGAGERRRVWVWFDRSSRDEAACMCNTGSLCMTFAILRSVSYVTKTKVKVGFEGFYNYKLLKIESMSLKPSFRSSQPVDGAQDRCEGNRQGLAEAACC